MLIRKIYDDDSNIVAEKLLVEREETENIALGYVSVNSGNTTETGFHDDEEEIYVILKGNAILTIGDKKQEIGPGSVAYVPRNHLHNMTCISEEKLEYLYFANWPNDK